MFQRQNHHEIPTCPDCGAKLTLEQDLLHCKEHGAFFAYGPQLLVRAPRPLTKPADDQLPWETQRARVA
jgi:hypothetical protein